MAIGEAGAGAGFAGDWTGLDDALVEAGNFAGEGSVGVWVALAVGVSVGELAREGSVGVWVALVVGVSVGELVGKDGASLFADLTAGLSVETPLGLVI